MTFTPSSWTASSTEHLAAETKYAELESCNNLAESAGSLDAISAMRWARGDGDWRRRQFPGRFPAKAGPVSYAGGEFAQLSC